MTIITKGLTAGLMLASVVSANAQSSGASDIEELLRWQHEARVAHVLADATAMVRGFADSVLQVNRGTVSVGTPAEGERRFRSYLESVDFLEWDNIVPPQITFSGDGLWAVVVVRKRVRYLARNERRPPHNFTVFAWTELWRRRGGEWELFQVASTDSGSHDDTVSLASRRRAHQILAASRAAMGGDSTIANVAMVSFTANAKGPSRDFQVEVRSARDGRAFMHQKFPDGTTSEVA